MRQLKVALVLAVAIILQSTLRAVWPPLVYVDLPLIVVVYFALQRDALQALLVGAIAGLATDALSGGLLGAGVSWKSSFNAGMSPALGMA